jgi:hypothetical protein
VVEVVLVDIAIGLPAELPLSRPQVAQEVLELL